MKTFRFALLTALACTGFGGPALGQTSFTWNNTGTAWTTGSWTPSGSPGSTDSAQFNVLGTFGASTINSPSLSSSTTIAQVSFSNTATFQGWALSGSGSLTAGSSTVSGLVARGAGTYSIDLGNGIATSVALTGVSGVTGPTTGGALNLGSGSTVQLTGNTIASLGTSALSFRGGALILDNSTGNPAGGQRLTGSGQLNFAGGGSILEFRSAGGGTNFTGLSGVVSLGGGDSTIKANQTGSGALNITFGSLERTSTTATVNFASTGSGTLGGGGANDPTIKFTTAPTLTNGVIANTAGSTALGFAVYNGTDFAGYDATKGVIAVASTSVSGALTTASTQNSRLTGNATTAASSTVSYNTLKIAPSAGGQSLMIGSGGTLNVVGILLAAGTDYTITGGTITGGSPRYLYVTNPNTTLFIGSAFSTQIFNKAGDGFMVLTGSTNQVAFTSTQGVNLTGGTMRVTSTNFNLSIATAANLRLRGGIIEYDVSGGNFTFNRPLGTAAGNVNWAAAAGPSTNSGSGGFSAFSTDTTRFLTVNLGGASAAVTWGGQTGTDVQFIQDGYALKFGSTKSNATVIWQNGINLDGGTSGNYLVREINVTRGVGNLTDLTRISGAITGSASTDLLKTGTGVLELSAINTYLGNTLVQGGTLVVSGTLGDPNSSIRTGNVVVGKGATLAGAGGVLPDQFTPEIKSVIVNPGGTIRGGTPVTATGSEHIGTLSINSNLTINSVGTDKGTLQFEASRIGANNADASKIALAGGFNLNLNPGGSQFIVELVQSSATTPLTLGETYFATLASVGPGGHIQLNGSNLAGGTTIDHTNYLLQSSAFPFDLGYTLQVSGNDDDGYQLGLTYKPMPVPEPTAVFGIAAGVLTIGARVRRRRVVVANS